MSVKCVRSPHNPVIVPESDPTILGNINGPSLIRVPEWVENPLGRYYLYFAHHQGKFIRMAYADDVLGPYTVHSPGVLPIEETDFERHIASPDVHVDDDARIIRMFYHGAGFTGHKHENLNQNTCYAESPDGVSFVCDRICLGPSYMRVWEWNGTWYGFGGGGGRDIWHTNDYRKPFTRGPILEIEAEDYIPRERIQESKKDPDDLTYRMRHAAVDVSGSEVDIYYSNVGDEPERIKRARVKMVEDLSAWKATTFEEVLRTETDYEGVEAVNEPSTGGADHDPVHQVRDPYIYNEGDRKYLVYSIAGEKGLGIAELTE
jgi:hypothetical protein